MPVASTGEQPSSLTYRTPIYTSIVNRTEKAGLRLHMPGHAGLLGNISTKLGSWAGLDLTELPELDDFHEPQGVIDQAQRLMARACGAQQSLFLVNGCTAGIHALLMSGVEGERVVIPRNSHRSFFGGLVLAGSIPVWIPAEADPDLGIGLAVKTETIAEALLANEQVGAVWLTSPSYYGTCCDVAAVNRLLAERDIPLMVDEAHGAHFPFHPLYPRPALRDGAAAVVNGLHKTWPVLTQCACLNLGRPFQVNPGSDSPDSSGQLRSQRGVRLMSAYHMLTTTSPSYPLMASIDIARDFMEREGQRCLQRALELSAEYKTRLNRIKGVRCWGEEWTNLPGIIAVDPLKVVVAVDGLEVTGTQMGELLRSEYGIEVEIAQPRIIMAMFSLLHNRDDWERFYQAVAKIAICYPSAGKKQETNYLPPPWHMVLSPREAFLAPKNKVRLKGARNMIAGEMVAMYPPGIPCLLPGELISDDILEHLAYLKRMQVQVQGPVDPELESILIIE